ncbi:hypothetical protein EV677_2241 [Herminiimonas fonticola]|uniref:Lipoprotein n=1 Tax=Herminiimonas fonticola TaxID=303380 RepID=A0A4R6G8M5_9BURK|nr:hypothetical protein EV677_2241 [Herminiimonas fonticola]
MIKIIGITPILFFLCSCSLHYMDAPPPSQNQYWIKSGHSLELINVALISCGYDEPRWSVEQQEKVDICMLRKGFVFRDSPYGKVHARCTYPPYQHLPSCQSMKK